MSNQKTLTLFLVLCAVLFGLGALKNVSQGRADATTLKQEGDAALSVVQRYYALASDGKADDLSQITTTIPKAALKPQPTPPSPEKKKELPPGTLTVAAPEGSSLRISLNWVRIDFPKSILENNRRIEKVGEIVVRENFAKVSVHPGNGQTYSLLPWVFMLVKEEGGQWKIYDIKSPAYAVDYYP